MEGDFNENLEKFLQENPKFTTNVEEERVVKVGKEAKDELATPSNSKFEEMARRMGLEPDEI